MTFGNKQTQTQGETEMEKRMKNYALLADDGREFEVYAFDKEGAKAKIVLATRGKVNIVGVWEVSHG